MHLILNEWLQHYSSRFSAINSLRRAYINAFCIDIIQMIILYSHKILWLACTMTVSLNQDILSKPLSG